MLAIVLATQSLSVLMLFVLADRLCATCCIPVIMGLDERVHPIAALAGCLAGLLAALLVYGIGAFGEAGGYVTLLAPGGLYATTALLAFLVVPVVSGVVTVAVAVPFHMQGYRFAGYPDAAPPSEATTGGKAVTVEMERA